MAKSTLVAKLSATPGVRNPQALAAWIGRYHKARKAGKSKGEATAAADGGGAAQGKGKQSSANGATASRLGLPDGEDARYDPGSKTVRVKGDSFPSRDLPKAKRNLQAIVDEFPEAQILKDEKGKEIPLRSLKLQLGVSAKLAKPEGDGPGKTGRVTGDTDPKKMTDDELDYFIKFGEMAVNARAQTPEVRRKVSARLIKQFAEKKRRQDLKALGYNYSPKKDAINKSS